MDSQAQLPLDTCTPISSRSDPAPAPSLQPRPPHRAPYALLSRPNKAACMPMSHIRGRRLHSAQASRSSVGWPRPWQASGRSIAFAW